MVRVGNGVIIRVRDGFGFEFSGFSISIIQIPELVPSRNITVMRKQSGTPKFQRPCKCTTIHVKLHLKLLMTLQRYV